tara:strand:+ start:1128 stop:4943 length:3816 start_codon:yes stop_codon:yes gene_type:complete
MTLNFPDSANTGDVFHDSTSGFSYEWNGTVWISTDPQRAANIKELDDISGSFNGSTTQFNLRVSSVAVEPVSDAQVLISVGGVMQNPTNDYTVSGSTITFTTAPSAGLTFFGVFLGQSLSLNTIADGTVSNTSFKAGTAGVGIQSGGVAIGVGITQINFIGVGNTVVSIGNTVNVSIASSTVGIDTTGTSFFNNITATGNLNVTGDLVYDEERVVNSIVSGTSTITNSNATQLLVSAGSTFNGDVDLGNATSDTITATGRFDSDIVPSTDNARDLGASGLEFKDLYIDGTANIDSLAADTAAIGDLTSGRVTFAGSSGELQDNAGLTFDGTTLAATRLAAPVAFTTSLTANQVSVTGVSTLTGAVDAQDIIKGYKYTAAPYSGTTTTLTVTVATKVSGQHRYHGQGSSLGYVIDGLQSPFLTLTPGNTYRFDQADSSNSSHQIKFYLESDKTGLYENGVTYNGTAGNSGAYTQIVVGDTTPTVLFYMCVNHGYMGNAAQTNSNILHSNYDAVIGRHLSVTGITTLTGNADFNGDLDVDGTTNLDVLDVDGASNFGDDVVFAGASYNVTWDKSANSIIWNDNAQALFGTGSDLKIRHDGTTGIIDNTDGNFSLRIGGENALLAVPNVGVTLYYDDQARINTTSVGVNVVGNVDCDSLNNAGISTFGDDVTFDGANYNAMWNETNSAFELNDNAKIKMGSGADMSIYHDGSNSYFENSTGYTYVKGDNISLAAKSVGENYLVANVNDGVDLYFNGSKKAETVTGGFTVTGTCSATAFAGDGSALTGVGGTIGVLHYNPVAGGEANITTGIGISFTTAVFPGSGTINVRQVSLGGTVIQAFGVGSSVRFSTSSLEMDMLSNFANDSVIAVELPANVVVDNAGDGNVAIGWTFRTTPVSNQVWVWGDNEYGGLGLNNADTPSYKGISSPVQLAGSNWVLAGSGGIQGFALLKTDGTLWRTGRGNYGNIGDNNDKHRSSPTQVPGTTWGDAVVGLYNFTVASKTDGTLWTWGNAGYAMGLNGPVGNGKSSPTQIPGTTWSSNARHGGQGSGHTRWIKTDGTLWAWGTNEYGQLGQGDKSHYSSPRQVGSSTNWVYTNRETVFSSFAVNTSGELYAWGRNNNGQLGLNNKTEQVNPTQVPGTNWSSVSARQYATLATKTDGTLWAWGTNTNGRLGQNNNTAYSSPRQIPGTNWNHQQICFLTNGSLALKTDGSMWGWGLNNRGALAEDSGNPSTQASDATAFSSPIQIMTDKTDWAGVQGHWNGYGMSAGLIQDTTP